MQQSGRVQRLETVGDLVAGGQQCGPVAPADGLVGRGARHEFHGVEGGPVGGRAELVDRDHRGVSEAREPGELVPELVERPGGAPEPLERAFLSGREVSRPEHFAPATLPESLHQDETPGEGLIQSRSSSRPETGGPGPDYS